MSDRQLSAEDYAIKAAFEELIEKVGGPTRAAALAAKWSLGVNQSRISNFISRNDTSIPRLDVIRAFERHIGDYPVTRELAAQHGQLLVPVCEAEKTVNWASHLGTVAKEDGEATIALATVVAQNAQPTAEKAAEIIRESREAMQARACLIADLEPIAAGANIARLRRTA